MPVDQAHAPVHVGYQKRHDSAAPEDQIPMAKVIYE
jgi:hypothetical protein